MHWLVAVITTVVLDAGRFRRGAVTSFTGMYRQWVTSAAGGFLLPTSGYGTQIVATEYRPGFIPLRVPTL